MPRVVPLRAAGVLAVKRVAGVPTVFPADTGEVAPEENLLRVVYDAGRPLGEGGARTAAWDSFDELRARVAAEWPALPRAADNLSASLRAKIAAQMARRGKVAPPAAAAAAALQAPAAAAAGR
jgi:nicotinamide phosphoribosyltransferase